MQDKTGRRETAKMVRLYEGPRQGKAAKCGHSVLYQSQPRTNCFDCWHYWFSLNPKTVYAVFDFLRTGREAEIKAAQGAKFLKHFKAFVSHVQSIAPVQAEDAVSATGEANAVL